VTEVRLAPGEILFQQGDPSELVYVVEEGEVELVRLLADRSEELLARHGAGQYFGELGPMFGVRRSATARATAPTRLLGLPLSEFRKRFGGLTASADACP
jgi:putative ABC transport system ATP-binding protein